MTADKHTKRAARDLAVREGISYTAARRRLTEPDPGPAAEPLSEPPRLYPIVTTPCTHGCDGTPHPGYVCETWHPFTSRGNARTSWDTCQAASLPGRRADSLSHRFREKPQYGYSQDQSWVLAAVYAMLLDEQPELAPDPHRLRAAVEADDLAAVDRLMHPLDLAAVRLLGCPIKEWWATGHPRLQAWATRVTTTEADEPAWDMTLIEYDSRCFKLAERFLKSQEERRNYNGYMETEHVSWWFSVPFLTELLRRQFGGLALRTHVRLPDGRPALVSAVEWADDGAPAAYRVRELEPGKYGNEGKVVPKLGGDSETVPAADCREDGPCVVCGGQAGMTEGLCEGCAARFIRCSCGTATPAASPHGMCAVCRAEDAPGHLDD
ncbi:hypothetical protein [Streptomyces ipomoeae]|uniref:hypothetical protein n=1 Tax=Streptomyces ipomoeae TaxID=103232 RepID=UPI0029A5010A|nr:hypothetical protein [Streptomyces ipomoeae]MDX2692170.1 hypothetical protein [Streptomyces ipomoeae]MDX2840497.1 hypothetical protein [Streptomyces ipomoeae]